MTKQINIRMPELTRAQLDELASATGLTTTQLIIMALDRLHTQLVERERVIELVEPALAR